MKRPRFFPGLALALTLSGCAAGRTVSVVQPGSPGEPSKPTTVTAVAGGYTADDVSFMHGMMHHHQQALDMVALIEARTDSEPLRLLGERIALTQREEIGLMRTWLEQRGESVPDPTAHAMMEMPLPQGMLTPEEMAALAASSGVEFERLFLEDMIRHHQGAVSMVDRLFASAGGGQESAVFQFASGVVSEQPIEIARMRRMLASLP